MNQPLSPVRRNPDRLTGETESESESQGDTEDTESHGDTESHRVS